MVLLVTLGDGPGGSSSTTRSRGLFTESLFVEGSSPMVICKTRVRREGDAG